MQPQSRKEILARTVRLLTLDQLKVTFRGVTPYVAADTRTGKATSLNLPEIPDEADPRLIDALQGYLDHEVGHVFFTPFDRSPKGAMAASLANIVEDIRLEKLLPRRLPGTRDNLERMYANWIPLMILPIIDKALATRDGQTIRSALLMPACRALSGQEAFAQLMEQRGLWKHIKPLFDRLPGIEAEMKGLETYDDVLAVVKRLESAMPKEAAPPPPPCPKPEPGADDEPQRGDKGEDDGEQGDDPQDGGTSEDDEVEDGEPEKGKGKGDKDGDEDESDAGDGDDADAEDGAPGDDDDDDASDDAGGGEPGADDRGSGEGDATEDDDIDGEGAGDAGGDDADGADDDGGESEGERNLRMMEALRLIDPTLRRAIYLHKHHKQSIADIASAMNTTEGDVQRMLREARRALAEILRNG